MTLANKITLARIALIPIFILFASIGGGAWDVLALILFCLCSFTDFLDGYVARKYNQVTDFGKFVDPLADKLLICAAMCVFVDRGYMVGWMVFIILAREFIITSLRTIAMGKNRVMAATWTGKVKTCTQIAGIILIFLCLIVTGDDLSISHGASILTQLCGWVMMLVTLYSGYDYLHRNWDLVAEGATKPKIK
ncbi:MAG: CDP-diacylglycerol--glycerol-3-phosphate 3-phosphatidyltransferase [Eubacteriales bacterium]|nr:CDP-diacylglycerol--glycerol-3-phosphate 3-phosphatidyltransferase [Eubacteriales bacterium]